ncbi:MAG: PD40 domain-containing protein [Bacteroidales bacterium]|nr:PD40 domain-containing protein [Bacteroidales bacterium]
MKKCLILCLVFVQIAAFGQTSYTTEKKSAIKAYTDGISYLNLRYYDKAIELFQKAIDIDEKFVEAYFILAQAYEDNKTYEKAIDAYNRGIAVNPLFFTYSYILRGNLEFKIGRYEDAKKSYQAFFSTASKNKKHIELAQKGIKRSDFAINAIKSPVSFNPVSLGDSVNSEFDEYWPCLTADENTLVFTRLVKDTTSLTGYQEDFYLSDKVNGKWGLARNAGPPLNSRYNEGAQTISADGRIMVFTACGREDAIGRCDLYISKKTGDQWSVPVNMGRPVNTADFETQPSLSADGRTLFFASDRAGGFGDVDIYYSVSDNFGNWSQPVNLGEAINTTGRDWAPFIHPDNRTLYFSSDNHTGMGGFDLFYARKDSSGKWPEPVNLGYPINTFNDEYGLVINATGDYALYASDRNQVQKRDIFGFNIPKETRPISVSYMKGKVFDADTKKLLGAGFELTDLATRTTISRSVSDSLTGEFLVCIPVRSNYLLNVSKDGYLFYSDHFSLDKVFEADEPFLKDVPLQPIIPGKSVVLKNIFYEFDSYKLKPESKLELDKLVQFMKSYPTVKIEVSGHTDNIGSEAYNLTLSAQRAKEVAGYLISQSIAEERITYTGYGYTVPIAPNDTEENRALNRRTEVLILEK